MELARRGLEAAMQPARKHLDDELNAANTACLALLDHGR
jgi:hypothetical protein